MPPGPGGFGKFYMITALINAATGLVNGHLARQQQERIAEENRKVQQSMEQNRQTFQLELNERNAETQRQLSLQSHQLRLMEQKANFEKQCQQIEWTRFMNTWPLINVPSVIRDEQILPDDTVSLRIIFSKNSNQVFSKLVYPQVEQGLRDFVDLYHNVFFSKNIIFYHNAFNGTVSGGAIDMNIHYALKELPVIIIDSNVLLDEICVSLTMWGFGSSEQSHFNVFTIPYQPQNVNESGAIKYYKQISDKILAYLKFVLGCSYDAYNLIQYDRPPLLPKVAAYEVERGARASLLAEPEIQTAIEEKYGEIYSMIIGSETVGGTKPFALLPDSFKGSILHMLRMEYAESVKSIVSEEIFLQYLNESLEAWTALRSDKSGFEFLNSLLARDADPGRYFSVEDKQYFERICALYARTANPGELGLLAVRVSTMLKRLALEEQSAEKAAQSEPEKKKRDFGL